MTILVVDGTPCNLTLMSAVLKKVYRVTLAASGDEALQMLATGPVADVYDALISRRPCKNTFSHDKAVQVISDGRGQHFDPDIVDAFMALQDEFFAISQRYLDSDEEIAEKARQIERMRGN